MIKLLNRVVLTAILGLFVLVGTAESGTIEVFVSVGITDADEVTPLQDGDLVQVIWVGPDKSPNPPAMGGAAGGDDELLRLEAVVGQRYTRIGSGFPFHPNQGKFHGDFRHNLSPGAEIFVRAWNASTVAESTFYGDSAPLAISDVIAIDESRDFALPGTTAWPTATEPPPGVGLDIRAPDNVTNFKAVAGDRMITLTWTNPADVDFKETFIVRRTGSYPTNIGDGTIVRSDQADPGTPRTWTNVGLSSGTTYFYTAFARDTSDNFASGVRASATTPAPAVPDAPANGCFIATAAFGTPLAEEIEALSKFRDRHLLTNEWGRRFVAFYYRHSPQGAELISGNDFLKTLVRMGLRPLIWLAGLII